MYCSSTPSSFVKGRFALKPLTNPGVKLFCVQANCPTSCIDTGSCHKCLCFLDEDVSALRSYCCYYENPWVVHLIESSKYKIKGMKAWSHPFFYILCGRRDLNPHRYTPTAPSRQRVCHSATTAQCM